MHLIRGTAVELHIAGKCCYVCLGLCERFAHIKGLKACQFICILKNKLSDLCEYAPALKSGESAPRPIKRTGC